MIIERCWFCWGPLAKKKGVTTWEEVPRPDSHHLKVHKGCKERAEKFLLGRQTVGAPETNLGLHGCSIRIPARNPDEI